jgi:hypothetical protein
MGGDVIYNHKKVCTFTPFSGNNLKIAYAKAKANLSKYGSVRRQKGVSREEII